MDNDLDFNHRNICSQINALIDQAFERDRRPRVSSRSLGASRLGAPCARSLQFEFFNTPKEHDFPPQMLRVFEAGYKFEDLCAKWLVKAGFGLSTRDPVDGDHYNFIVVWDDTGVIQGNIDGIILEGPPCHQYPALWECKSMNNKNFNKLCKYGLAEANEGYFVQVQIAMAYVKNFDLTVNPCLFTAVNKDSQELYFESIPFDSEIAQRYSDRAAQIMTACASGELLPRIASSSDHFICKYCNYVVRCYDL